MPLALALALALALVLAEPMRLRGRLREAGLVQVVLHRPRSLLVALVTLHPQKGPVPLLLLLLRMEDLLLQRDPLQLVELRLRRDPLQLVELLQRDLPQLVVVVAVPAMLLLPRDRLLESLLVLVQRDPRLVQLRRKVLAPALLL